MDTRRTPEESMHRTQDPNSVRGLFSELGDEITRLFRQEIALARAETSSKITQASAGGVKIATGGVIVGAALVVLLMAAVYGLATLMHPAWAALIVGVVAIAIGGIMAKSGSSKLKSQSLMPHRTEESLRRDANVIKHEVGAASRRNQS